MPTTRWPQLKAQPGVALYGEPVATAEPAPAPAPTPAPSPPAPPVLQQ